jgi:hypothetical protein
MMPENRMAPANFTIDLARQAKLQAIARVTHISKSGLVRILIDRLAEEVGDPENPNPEALLGLMKVARESDGNEAEEEKKLKKDRPK